MARDDREQNLEKALARRLRADKIPTSAGARCADAEILAAYQERGLPPQEMKLWKEHISSCSRCQQILAQVQATETLQLGAVTQVKDDVSERAKQKAPVLLAKTRRSRLWLWAVPAGAVAAGLLVWIVSLQKTTPLQMAKNEQPVSLSPTVPRSEAPSTAGNAATDAVREKPDLAARERSPLLDSKQFEPKTLRMQTPAAPPSPPRKDQRDARTVEALNSVSAGRAQPVQGAVGGEVDKLKKTSPSAAAPALPPMRESITVNTEAADAIQSPAPSSSAKLAKAKAATPAPELQTRRNEQLQQMQGMSRFSDAPQMLLANDKSPVVIATPNKKVSWRVGRAGSIERSEDAGATWSLQTSGAVSGLLAGSAPSDSVCWVVGQLGTILRTTDSGATWTKVQAPVAEDIRSVFAVNAQQATISTAHATYQTSDGGATWTKLAPE
jgi:Photosynthesis system II assembly factor YCF48